MAKFKEGTSESQIEQLIESFANLVNLVEPMKSFHWGKELSIEKEEEGYTHVFETTFESVEGMAEYAAHPAHHDFAKLFLPNLEKIHDPQKPYRNTGYVDEDTLPVESTNGAAPFPDVKARADAVWEQMNKGVSNKQFKDLLNKSSSSVNKTPKKSSNVRISSFFLSVIGWLGYLGLAQKKAESPKEDALRKRSSVSPNSSGDNGVQDKSNDEARRLVAAALVEVKDAAVATSGRGKVELCTLFYHLFITEVRDSAGQEIEYKKLVDADSKEASEKVKAPAPSGVDAFLEQLKKKPKLSVLDKTKKDWGEFKEEKGLEGELESYKKSSNQYLDKVNFLQRADFREFERERDAQLAVQAKRKPDMREDP
ncbi:unnamed protein product [Malus baccata var. baccata]